ncbi:unnamed protein product, partial [Didymodactylos carnosus]
ILKILLADLIEKQLPQDRNNSKMLLRSNESVAEKMLTNWFAFFLYHYIRNHAGTPLYILFQSIKQQIHKGPVDVVTSESRYSLSEDKLIRQHVDYNSYTIFVSEFDDKPVPVKVLSCDTITQVKEKILDTFYKGIPYSKRPKVDNYELGKIICIKTLIKKSKELVLNFRVTKWFI